MPGIKKYVKKQARRVGRYAKKRYFKGKGYSNPKLGTMMRDINTLKAMVNAEKKNVDVVDTSVINFAGNNGVDSGGAVVILHPGIPQGVGEDQRIGDSIKAHSAMVQFEVFNNGPLTIQDTKYSIYIVRQPVNPISGTANVLASFLEPNPFSGVVDYNSNRNYENFKDWVVIKKVNGTLRQNDNDGASQVRKNQHKIPLKLNFHMRYSKGTNSLIANPIYAILVADSGNTATTNLIKFQFASKLYCYDN